MRDDVERNVTLCKLVRKYPPLYDTRPGRNRNVKNRIWDEIGSKMDESATACKQRWRQIRGRYWDYLAVKDRQSSAPSGKRFVLTYYLASKLQFLDRFMIPRRGLKGQAATKKLAIMDAPRAININETKDSVKVALDKDMELLTSALPNLKGLNRVQNKKFKIGVVNLMARVLEQQKTKELLVKRLTKALD